ncbi:MAG: FkbM family methyltransferase [Saprospiraceae bacterium]
MSKKPKLLTSKLIPRFIKRRINGNITTRTILDHYKSLEKSAVSQEEKIALEYLSKNGLCVFPYSFTDKYKKDDIVVHDDEELKLKYVFLDGKRLYFKRNSSTRGIKRNYSRLLAEQDLESPHRYLTDDFDIGQNAILVDVGAAEGNLPLSVIEKVSKVYLFETDPAWIEALEATFAPWKDKVEIVNKFVSNTNDASNVSLDEFFGDKPVFDVLKVDAEGAEADILEGSKAILATKHPMKLALCCYHKPHDDVEFTATLSAVDFSISFADGYMIFTDPATFFPPYLRRGVLRAVR